MVRRVPPGGLIDGRYEVVRMLGRGGMGEVHEAVDQQTRRRVAVKFLLSSDAPREEALTRFQREILASAQVRSPHVVSVLDAGTDPEAGPFMVMEYLEGEDLSRLAHRLGPLPVDLALRLVAQACEGVAAAHETGIIHRDLKPANLFLTDASPRVVKVLDFGVARTQRLDVEELTRLTRTGVVVGSPAYMAPEQLSSGEPLDQRLDVWALGVVLYRLLAGAVPHSRHVQQFAQLSLAICHEPAPRLEERAPWVPVAIADLVHRALAIDVGERLPSCRAFADELRALLPHGTEVTSSMLVSLDPALRHAVSSARTGNATVADGPVAREAAATKRDSPGRRARRVRASFVLALVAALGFGGLALFLRESPAPAIPELTAEALLDLRPEIAATSGARWFVSVRDRCIPFALAAALSTAPDGETFDVLGFRAACAAIAGRVDVARANINRLPYDERALGVEPVFNALYPYAYLNPSDYRVAESMELVLEYWPTNEYALYAAAVAEYQSDDPKARAHLVSFLGLDRPRDELTTTLNVLLDDLSHPRILDCTVPIARDALGHIIFPGRCRHARAK